MFFSNTHWPQLTAPFNSILFETSICQFNSSKCPPIMPDEVREYLTRDQTIPLSRMTPDPLDSQLLLFSSPHSSSTGFRTEDWNGQQKIGFVLGDLFLRFVFGLLYGWKIQTWPIIRFKSVGPQGCAVCI